MYLLFVVFVGLVHGQVTFIIDGDTTTPITLTQASLVYRDTYAINIAFPDSGTAACNAQVLVDVADTTTPAPLSFVASSVNTTAEYDNGQGTRFQIQVVACGPGIQGVLSTQYTQTPVQHTTFVTAGTCAATAPVTVAGEPECTMDGFISVVLGSAHGCGLRSNGEVYCWGSNAQCQMGTGTASTTPFLLTKMPVFSDFTAIYANNGQFTCGLRTPGSVWTVFCWGQPVGSPNDTPDGTNCTTNTNAFMIIQDMSAPPSIAMTATAVITAMCCDTNIFVTGVAYGLSPPISTTAAASVYVDIAKTNTAYSAYAVYAYYVQTNLPSLVSAFVQMSDYGFVLVSSYFHENDDLGISGDSLLTSVWWIPTETPSSLPTDGPFGGAAIVHTGTGANPITAIPIFQSRFSIMDNVQDLIVTNVLYYNSINFFGYAATSGNRVEATGTSSWLDESAYTIQSGSITGVSIGNAQFCIQGTDSSVCTGTGSIPTQLRDGAIHRMATSVFTSVATGGDYTCVVLTGRIYCTGPADETGVVQSYVPISNNPMSLVRGACTHVSYATATQTNHSVVSLFRSNPNRCLGPIALFAVNETCIAYTSAMINQTDVTCGGNEYCLSETGCTDRRWVGVAAGTETPTYAGVQSIGAGDAHTCFIDGSGTLYCAGDTDGCAFVPMPGEASDTRRMSPVFTGLPSTATAATVWTRGTTTCVRDTTSTHLSCFGQTFAYEWCSSTSYYRLDLSATMSTITDVFIGINNLCVVTFLAGSHYVACLGLNKNNMLATLNTNAGMSSQFSSPVFESGNADIFTSSAAPVIVFSETTDANDFMYIHDGAQTLYCAGMCSSGVVSNYLIVQQASTPPYAFGISTAVASLAASVFAANTTDVYGAASILALNGISDAGYTVVYAASGSSSLACVLLSAGYYSCSHSDYMFSYSVAPINQQIVDGDGTIVAIAVGEQHIVFLTSTGRLYCTGSNSAGQCGRTDTAFSTSEIVEIDPALAGWPGTANAVFDTAIPATTDTAAESPALTDVKFILGSTLDARVIGTVIGVGIIAFALSVVCGCGVLLRHSRKYV